MPLTDKACKAACAPAGRPYARFTDGLGLYLEATAAGSKLWRWKYRVDGREKRLALGRYPDVSLAEARKLRDQARLQLGAGVDPSAARRDAKAEAKGDAQRTFEAVARAWWADWKAIKTERYADYVLKRLAADVFPAIGSRPIDDLVAPDFVKVAKAVEARGPGELPRRLLETCGQVMRYAVGHGYVSRNSVADVKPGDVLRARVAVNFARVDPAELPLLLRRMAGYEGGLSTRTALMLMALTFVRTSELIEARWGEFDLERAEWTVPADRVGRKGSVGARRSHLVPLSRQAVDLLRTLAAARGSPSEDMLLFPGERDPKRPMSNNTMLKALERMGYKGRQTGHGFRGLASTALNEMGYRSDVIEAQLSHVDRDRVRSAYNHAQYRDERRELMQAWADYLDAMRTGGQVIPLRRARPSSTS